MEPLRVSAVEFGRDVDHHQDVPLRQPVVVTCDGRDRTVLISVEEYARLTRRDREVMTLDDFTDADIEALEASRPPASATAFDHDSGS